MDYHRIEFRVSLEQAALITDAAESVGLPVATWVRLIAVKAARREREAIRTAEKPAREPTK